MLDMIQLLSLAVILHLSICKLLRVPAPGQIMGGYRVSIFIGDPLVEVPGLMLDTGSPLTIIPCSSCLNCGSKQGLYNPSRSFNSRIPKCSEDEPICKYKCMRFDNKCQFQISYMEGTQGLGQIVHDSVSWIKDDVDTEFRSYVGCLTVSNQVHRQKSILILGLNPNPTDNILYSWFKQHPEDQYRFSTCMTKKDGFFQIGVNPGEEHLTPDLTLHYDNSNKQFKVKNLNNLKYGEVDISSYVSTTIIDTGSSFFHFPEKPFNKMQENIFAKCNYLSQCLVFYDDENTNYIILSWPKDKVPNLNDQFQKLTFQVGNTKYQVLPQDYFFIQDQPQSGFNRVSYRAAISWSQEYPLAIFGMKWMQNKKLTFDLLQETISVYNNYNCTFTPIVNDSPSFFSSLTQTISSQALLIGLAVLAAAIVTVIYRYGKKMRLRCRRVKKFILLKVKNMRREEDDQFQEQDHGSSNTQVQAGVKEVELNRQSQST